VRGIHPDSLPPVERAARTLFLNRTCFNGLYRVNSQGLFNVPYGSQRDRAFFQPEALRGAHRALAGVRITCADFASSMDHVRPRDFVYLDPPYVSGMRAGAGFASYQAAGFAEQDQRRLATTVRSLDERGAFVMVSNSDGDLPRELYGGLHVETLSVRRQVGGHTGRRGDAAEILVRNYRSE
jgi:DNA adenine methylase